ncbi:MAG TPA: molybdenum-dependent transcriptional regulator [Desulfomicrobium sp.]|nr:molybdenum-dependent transcriptional regulator [Desulfomicrobium sp.]
MKKAKTKDMSVLGEVWFSKAGQEFLGHSRIELLEKIDQYGSITKAGKAQGISYKTAWEQVDALNNLADEPLVIRTTGGRGGGGTRLTEAGQEVVKRYRMIQREHERFLQSIGEHLEEGEKFYQFLRKINMKVSARNLWSGRVEKISRGEVNALVELQLKGEDRLSALITTESLEALGLTEGSEVLAMVKAPAVMIVKDLGSARLSAINSLQGTVRTIIRGTVNADLTLELPGGSTVSATLTLAGDQHLELQEGDTAWAVFQESSIILGVL